MYNSFEYWNERKEPNKYNHIMDYEKREITPFVKDCKTVLDFGCGIGRTFPLYEDKQVTGVDFSAIYKDRCDARYNHIVHNVHDSNLPFHKNTFDKGLLIKVLLHAPENEVKTILKEVGRVCKEVMLISYYGNLDVLAPHVFKHEYIDIIKDLGFKVKYQKEIEDNQIVIVYSK